MLEGMSRILCFIWNDSRAMNQNVECSAVCLTDMLEISSIFLQTPSNYQNESFQKEFHRKQQMLKSFGIEYFVQLIANIICFVNGCYYA